MNNSFSGNGNDSSRGTECRPSPPPPHRDRSVASSEPRGRLIAPPLAGIGRSGWGGRGVARTGRPSRTGSGIPLLPPRSDNEVVSAMEVYSAGSWWCSPVRTTCVLLDHGGPTVVLEGGMRAPAPGAQWRRAPRSASLDRKSVV